jgi:ABC-type bacteriocin/lantibiotic exporter with double-glycine peptidase domain
VTGGLLIMGTMLVINREITLGQFVASEIIIILILNAVEKVIMYMDIVYDLLTAVDKIGHITDLPLDKTGGIDFPTTKTVEGYAIDINNLKFKYADSNAYTLNGITLSIKRGERICISGTEGSGKTTLTKIIGGLHPDFEGAVTINNYSIRDLDLTHLRNKMAKSISPEDIFDGTILENITLGKHDHTPHDAMQAIAKAGLQIKINSLPEGLNTHIISGGKGLSSTMIHRLILARCIAKNPELMILNDFFSGLTKSDKIDLMQRVLDQENRWTLITESNDPLIMAACDRVVIMHDGNIKAIGKFEELMHEDDLKKFLE